MDPVSIVGLSVAIQQILTSVYNFAEGVRESRMEINQLCSELLGLKAALEHVQMNLALSDTTDSPTHKTASSLLASANLMTPEFREMISSAETILKELLARLHRKPGRMKLSLQRLTWPLIKDEVKRYVERLHRLSSWFVLATTSDNQVICRESYDKICSIEHILQEQVVAQEHHHILEERKAVSEWMAPFDPRPLHERASSLYLLGTGNWFLDGPFRTWLDGDGPPILWLSAKPGTGKTTLLSASVRRATSMLNSERHQKPLVFFYCSFSHRETRDRRTIIASLLAQLCDFDASFWEDINAQYQSSKGRLHHAGSKMSFEEALDILEKADAKAAGMYLFLDAVNESDQTRNVLDFIRELLSILPSIRVMISSTEEVDNPFEEGDVNLVPMAHDSVTQDILHYIETWISTDSSLAALPSKLKAHIKRTLQMNHDGMFRWVQCQLEALRRKRTPKDIRDALRNVPKTLAATYQNILLRIPTEDTETARQMLLWISSAITPMTLSELSEAVIIDEDQLVIDEDMRLLDQRGTLELCSSLITYDSSTTKVMLAHSSVLDYLISRDIRNSDAKNFYLDRDFTFQALPQRCIKYLLLPAFSSGYCSNKKNLDHRLRSWPLLTYIADTLFDHLMGADLADPTLNSLVLRFFETHQLPRGGNFGAWVQAFLPRTTFNIESSTPLYYAARFGLVALVRLILQTRGTIDLEKPGGGYGSTPLHVAAWAGRREVVAELLQAGANAKEKNYQGSNGLYYAMMNGDTIVEAMLRKAGAVEID